MTYKECYDWGVSKLELSDVPEAKLDARLLLEAICDTDRNALLVHGDREIAAELMKTYEAAISKREKRIPLQHILGYQEFMGLSFQVNEHVLIPRQDTEVLVEQALDVLKAKMKESKTATETVEINGQAKKGCGDGKATVSILDMCTGSGCILVSLLKMCPGTVGLGVDVSQKALEVATANGEAILALGQDTSNCVNWLCSDMFDKVEGKFDVITSNPPYIPTKVIEGLMPEVRIFEPMCALDGMEDGLFFYRQIAALAPNYLKAQGHLFLEIGHDQGLPVSELLREHGFTNVEVIKDYAGLDRVVHATL